MIDYPTCVSFGDINVEEVELMTNDFTGELRDGIGGKGIVELEYLFYRVGDDKSVVIVPAVQMGFRGGNVVEYGIFDVGHVKISKGDSERGAHSAPSICWYNVPSILVNGDWVVQASNSFVRRGHWMLGGKVFICVFYTKCYTHHVIA